MGSKIVDLKNAFLNEDLEEEIYMKVHFGFESDLTTKKVCKLKKALYGLKQSLRVWFGRFAKVMKNMGYIQCQGDHMLFIKHLDLGGFMAFLVYVDDIIVIGNDENERQTLRQYLTKEFEIKELGKLKYFLEIEVAHSKQRIFISQQKYVMGLLKETGKLMCKPTRKLIDPNHKLGEVEEDATIDREMYQRQVGRRIYLSHTRLDIVYVVSVIS